MKIGGIVKIDPNLEYQQEPIRSGVGIFESRNYEQ